jgi:hypothetical protein
MYFFAPDGSPLAPHGSLRLNLCETQIQRPVGSISPGVSNLNAGREFFLDRCHAAEN